ncbi:ATP-binding protein, partial [Proteus mirabilis]
LLDNIFICGGFRAVPILSFSEIERQPITLFFKPNTLENINSIERVACIIINKKQCSDISISINHYFSMSQNRKKAIKQLVKNWHRCINKQTGSIYITALL